MPGFPCCCKTCVIYKDTFDRPDKPQLDQPWLDDGTTFKIEDFAAKPKSSTGIAVLDIQHPVPDTSMHVIMTIKDEIENAGLRYRVMVNVVRSSSPSNYYFADFIRNSVNTSIIKLGVCSNGIETILAEDIVLGLVGFNRQFEVLLADNEFCARVSNSTLSLVSTGPPPPFPTGYYCGMAAYSSSCVIDEFTFLEHFKTNEECKACLCKCDEKYIPPMLNARIYQVPEECARLNLLPECEFPLYWNRINEVWQGEQLCCTGYPNSGQNWKIDFKCPVPQDDPFTATMAIQQGCTNSCENCLGPQTPVEASCSPFKMVYGPYNVAATDLTCNCSSSSDIFGRGSCNYYIEITG